MVLLRLVSLRISSRVRLERDGLVVFERGGVEDVEWRLGSVEDNYRVIMGSGKLRDLDISCIVLKIRCYYLYYYHIF